MTPEELYKFITEDSEGRHATARFQMLCEILRDMDRNDLADFLADFLEEAKENHAALKRAGGYRTPALGEAGAAELALKLFLYLVVSGIA